MFTDVRDKALGFVTENATVLLTAGGVVGVVGTGVLAAKAAFGASTALEAEKVIQYSENLTPGEPINTDAGLPKLDTMTTLKIAGPHFIPPFIVGGATIVSIIMAHRMSSAKIAALAAAYGLAERNLGEYKEKVTEKLTGPKKQAIDDELAQDRVNKTPGHQNIVIVEGEVLCFDEPTARYFRSTMERIRSAVNATNAEIVHHDHANATFFYEEIELPGTTWTDEVGWNADQLLELKYSTVLSPDGKPCISIDFQVLPKMDYVPKHY